ncbi:hypothetical protein HK099_005092 [Clydaea vesicula]|uniref:DUF2415 domain-containing protein n=1 Tax=Clydaea vesicula TaxID=447962 RepID=A0AAD5TZE4_9FUNG|nr:hypothetical protein HK099_005092 [Clydaea vesicula]
MTQENFGKETCENEPEFVSSPVKHQIRSSIQHWQLRDLVACPEKKNEVIFVNQNNVLKYDTTSKITSPVLKDLTFSPTSMTTGCGYVAAGGQRSQLMVRQLASNWCISEHLNGARLLICNNDETIKVYSLPGLQRMASISLPTAVNYCAVSPDGRKMLGAKDAGFSCAWNHSSEKFAVASQDGVVCVWDVRSTEKLALLNSKQYPQVKGACRCLKFSPTGSIDLLMYSEHVSYFNLVDARTFNQKQSIRVSQAGGEQHISGIAFSPESKNIFVGLESTILEYQVDTLSRRCFPEGSII